MQQNWFPPLEQNGIIYEMEYVESKKGSYPATEGLLKLLAVLFASTCCPTDLGSGTRKVPGCSPYIEYVIDFVLPRIMEVKSGKETLYFSSKTEKYRLLTRALEVINAVLVRYEVPSLLSKTIGQVEPTLVAESSSKMDIETKKNVSVHSNKVVETSTPIASLSLVHDDIHSVQRNYGTSISENDFYKVTSQQSSSRADPAESIPQAKSPGFYVLANLLSSDGALLNILCQIWMQDHKIEILGDLDGDLQSAEFNINALYGEIIPHYSTVKGARDLLLDQRRSNLAHVQMKYIPPQFLDNFMESLFSASIQEIPQTKLSNSSFTTVSNFDEISWKEHCILFILKIICAAAGRDIMFKRRINESKHASSLVPVLKFCPRDNRAVVPLLIKQFQVKEISKLIVENHTILPLLFQCVGYKPISLSNNSLMASAAVSIIQNITENVQHSDFSRCLKGMDKVQRSNIAISFSERLSSAKEDKDNFAISSFILKQLASEIDLAFANEGEEYLSHIILGLSCRSNVEMKEYLYQSSNGIEVDFCDYNNVLDVLIALVSDMNFILEPDFSALACKCYEVIYRLCNNEKLNHQLAKLCIMIKLRKIKFWHMQMLRFLVPHQSSETLLKLILSNSLLQEESSMIQRDGNFLHCISWILKGIGIELHSLMGHGSFDERYCGCDPSIRDLLSPQPAKCRELLSILCGDSSAVIMNALQCLPIKKRPIAIMLSANAPSKDVLKAASQKMEGPDDICNDYHDIDIPKLIYLMNQYFTNKKISEDEQNAAIKWASKWNSLVNFSCASFHFSDSWCFLTETVASCSGVFEDETSSDRYLIETLIQILICLNDDDSSIVSNGSIDAFAIASSRNGELDPSVIHPLAVSSLTIMEQVIANGILNHDEGHQILLLLIGAIAGCDTEGKSSDVSNMTRAAYLSFALTTLVEFLSEHDNYLFVGSSLQLLQIEVSRAAPFLARLSVLSSIETQTEENDEHFIVQAARAGLASLINVFDSVETSKEWTGNGNHVVQLFASKTGITINNRRDNFLSRCLELLEKFDSTVIELLQVIASSSNGTDILVTYGLSKTLVKISRKFFDDNKNLSTSTYGSAGVQVPTFLSLHFALFSSMLSSKTSRTVRLQLVADAVIFLQMHSRNAERIFSGYPKNNELIINLVTTFSLISSSCADNGNDGFMETSLRTSEWFVTLEHQVIDLAFHLAAYPLPPQYLIRLPKELRVTNKVHSNQTENCWWDAVESKGEDDILLPHPIAHFMGQRESRTWSSSKYDSARFASQFFDLCLHYLLNKFNVSNVFAAETLPLATAICRYADILQVN